MVFNVNNLFFTQRLLTTTVVYLKLMLLFLTFCSFILLTEYSLDLLLVNFISGRTIGLCMDVEWWMASNCLPRAWSRCSAEAGRVFPLPHSFQSSLFTTLADWQAPRPLLQQRSTGGRAERIRRATCLLSSPNDGFPSAQNSPWLHLNAGTGQPG